MCGDLDHLSHAVALQPGTKVRVPIFGEGTVVVAPRKDDGVVAVDFGWAKAYLGPSAAISVV